MAHYTNLVFFQLKESDELPNCQLSDCEGTESEEEAKATELG